HHVAIAGCWCTHHDYINDFTSRLPCYNLNLGSDLEKIPPLIAGLLSHREKYTDPVNFSPSEKSWPLISVIIPVYNSEKFIRIAVENVMAQNYPAIELIIVDDGSTDQTKEIIMEIPYDIRFFHQPNEGPAAARNRGIRDASGEYYAFLDADDLWPENNLHLLLEEIEKDRDLEVVRGHAQVFSNIANDRMEFLGNPKESFPDYIGAGLYRKSLFQKVGLFDPFLRFGEDKDWFNRAHEANIIMKRLDVVTLLVRRHGANMTEGKSLVELNALKVFRKVLERMRHESQKE
ncbi:MAG: glycosyltransferase family 2 protein, partial [Bacteroidia bacterium]|nr:glycosyltransferase family 2 protein [Bacteroidia bacterium]